MNKKNLLISYVGIVLCILLIFANFYVRRDKNISIEDVPVTNAAEISLSELQKNNTVTSCWIAFGGQVFNITDYINMDQNSELKPICGTSIDTLPDTIKKSEKFQQYKLGILIP